MTATRGAADPPIFRSNACLMATVETIAGARLQTHEKLGYDNWGQLPFSRILTILPTVRTEENAMPTDATLTSKGQTTIPKEIRDGLGMKTGDRITFTLMPGATVLMRVKNKSVTELAGLLHKKGRKPVPIEQLSR